MSMVKFLDNFFEVIGYVDAKRKHIGKRDSNNLEIRIENLFKWLIGTKGAEVCHCLENYNTVFVKLLNLNSLLSLNPTIVFDKKYKNLRGYNDVFDLPETSKIPRTLHHIWFTNKNINKQIPDKEMEYILKAREIISQRAPARDPWERPACVPWEHILWTNDITLISDSIKTKLKENGIQIKVISELKELKLGKQIEELIENGMIGLAFDAARLDIARCYGGVISDINFQFSRSLEPYVRQYDFFAESDHDDSLRVIFQAFGTKAHHPILEEAVDLFAKHCEKRGEIASRLDIKENSEITYIIVGPQLAIAYYMMANKFNTTDVLFPSNFIEVGNFTDHYARMHKIFPDFCREKTVGEEKYNMLSHEVSSKDTCATYDLSLGVDLKAHSWFDPKEEE